MVLNRKQIAVMVAALLAVLAQVAFWVPVTLPGEPAHIVATLSDMAANNPGPPKPTVWQPELPPRVEYQSYDELHTVSTDQTPPPVHWPRLFAHFAAIAAVAVLLIALVRSRPDAPRGITGADGR